VDVTESDGTVISVFEEYVAEHYNYCDLCEKYHEDSLTEIDNDMFVCSKCLENKYEFVDGFYILQSAHAS